MHDAFFFIIIIYQYPLLMYIKNVKYKILKQLKIKI